MSTIPPSIAGLSQILKNEGHITSLFDTTFYKFDDEITIEDSDAITAKALTNRPVTDIDDDDLHFKKTTKSAVDDFRKAVLDFKPDIIAVSCTETTFLRGMKIIDETRAQVTDQLRSVEKELLLLKLENSPEEQSIENEPSEESTETQEGDVSLDNLKDEEIASEEQKDSDTSNS